MNQIKNEFSWSKNRDEIFGTCPRQYWFTYYGFWNGWLKDGLWANLSLNGKYAMGRETGGDPSVGVPGQTTEYGIVLNR